MGLWRVRNDASQGLLLAASPSWSLPWCFPLPVCWSLEREKGPLGHTTEHRWPEGHQAWVAQNGWILAGFDQRWVGVDQISAGLDQTCSGLGTWGPVRPNLEIRARLDLARFDSTLAQFAPIWRDSAKFVFFVVVLVLSVKQKTTLTRFDQLKARLGQT